MRWLRYAAIAGVVLLVGWVGIVRVFPAWRARPIRPVMDAYLRAAASNDSAALEQVSAASYPVHWALTVERQIPAFIEAARRAHPEWVYRRQDTLTVSFRLAHPVTDPMCALRPLDDLQAKFVKGADGTWRIIRVAVPEC